MSIRPILSCLILLAVSTSCSRDPNVIKARYLQNGNRYFERGKYKEASIMYRTALQKDAKYGEAYYRLALTELRVDQPFSAVQSLRRAVELSDRSFDRIGWYLEMQTGEAEPWMCAAFARLCASPLVRRYLAPSDPRAIGRLADIELQDAMAGVLVGAGRERPRRDGDARRIDLLSPRHSARTFRERGGDSLGPTRGYHRAIDLTSRFTFHRTEATALHARLTLRLPSTAGEADDVALWINDEPLATITASREWRTHELDLVARGGANEFRIEWPMREPRSAETLERDARKLERAVYPDALPAYGEIFALTLTLRREAPRPPTS